MFETSKIGHFPILGIILVTLVVVNNAIRLSPEGGYDLVVGVETEDIVEPNDQLRYIQNIKNSMQLFSTQLWRATKMRFYIKSLELIVPETWTIDGTPEYAALGGIQSADFRVSSKVKYPNAKNPYLCGLPGDYIELPYNFFNNANTNEFGPIWKTLTVLFARYRYGVWEEHGFIGDEMFPYFFQNVSSATWETTGCNNGPLVGKFVDVTDPDRKACDMSWSSTPSELSACRFIPDRVQNMVTTSLMHFHWLDSVVHFCDETTHNSHSDNKQNAFCDHKSVMEVITESPDYATVTSPRNDIPPIAFKTVMQSAKPLLYILLDRGQVQGPVTLANMIPPALATFLNRPLIQNVIAGVGSFPNPDNAAIQLKEEVGWSQIGSNFEQFLQAVGDLRLNGPIERDFSQAILEAAGLIKARSHIHGAVILVVKYGANEDSLNKSVPQMDVVLALNDQKIILHSIELGITGSEPRAHLSQLAGETRGGSAALTSIGEAGTAMDGVLNFVLKNLNSFPNFPDYDYTTDQPTRRTVIKRIISASLSGIQIVLPPTSQIAEVFYSSDIRLTQDQFDTRTNGPTGEDIVVASFRRTVDWNAGEGNAAYSYRMRFNEAQIVDKDSVTVLLNCTGLAACKGEMIGRVTIDETNVIAEIVKIEVTTSSNVVDLSKQKPLTIYAKATINGIPIKDMYAEAIITNGIVSHTVTLHDDASIPDILEMDGIFSTFYVPLVDGDYRISVRFMKQSSSARLLQMDGKENSFIRESSLGRLLPIDQSPGAGCEVTNNCPPMDVHDGFMQVEDLPFPVVFSNASQFQARPGKVILKYTESTRTIEWLSPRVPGISSNTPVTSYEIRKSGNRRELLDNFDSCEIATTVTPTTPGTKQFFQHDVTIDSLYFGIKSVYEGSTSEISNIKGSAGTVAQTSGTPGPSTTPITTTSTDPNSTPIISPTTPDPSATPITTTTPDPNSTPISTTTPDPNSTPISNTTPDPNSTPISNTTPDPGTSPITSSTVVDPGTSPITTSTTPGSTTVTVTTPPVLRTSTSTPTTTEKHWIERPVGIGIICGIIALVILIIAIYGVWKIRSRMGFRKISA